MTRKRSRFVRRGAIGKSAIARWYLANRLLNLGHLFAELDVLRFIEWAFLSKHMIGTYNHYSSESIVVLSTLMKERFSWRFVWSSPSSNDFASAFTRSKNVSCIGPNHRRTPLCSACSLIFSGVNRNSSRKTRSYDNNSPSSIDRSNDPCTKRQTGFS